jgi:hypothetical protein
MVIAYDNTQWRHSATTFLLRVETISEIWQELKLLRRNGKMPLIPHRTSSLLKNPLATEGA